MVIDLDKITKFFNKLLKPEFNEVNNKVCLNDTDEVIVKLLFLENYTVEDIAQALHKPISYINLRLSYLALRLEKLPQFQEGFNVNIATEEQVKERCRKLGKKPEYTKFCIDAFVNKLSRKELAEKYCIEPETVKSYKRKRKKDLENTTIA